MAVARVKNHLMGDDAEIRIIWAVSGDGMFIECEYISPPSMVGRGVDIYLSEEEVTKLLLDLRERAIYARSKPMSERT